MFEDVVTKLVDMTDDQLDEHIGALELAHRSIEAELAAAIAVADARQLNQADAHRSMKGYLKATCNWSNHEVGRWRSAAAAVNAHPSIGDAWIAGHIGAPQVAVLAKTHGNRRVRDALPSFLPLLVANAEELNFEDFVATVERFVAQADADGAHDARDDAIEHRQATVASVGESLAIRCSGGDGITTAEVIDIFQLFCDAEFRKDLETRRELHRDDAEQHPLARTAAQRSYDALVAIFRAANGATASGVTGRAADTVVNIVIDANTFARIAATAGLAPTSIDGLPVDPFTGLPATNTLLDDLMADHFTVDGFTVDGFTVDPANLNSLRCETDGGVPVHPHDVLRALLAGHVRRVVLDSDGHVIDHGRQQRLFEGAAREAAKLLVRHCEHPGCDLPAEWCHVDHNIEWHDGGTTDQANAGVLCGGHNRAKHQHKLQRRRATNGVNYTIRADGTIILPVGARAPRFGPVGGRRCDPHVDSQVGLDLDPDVDPDVDPDHVLGDWSNDPNEIKHLHHLARERLRALCDVHVA